MGTQLEEVCDTKLVNPHPVYKKILETWCTKRKPIQKKQPNIKLELYSSPELKAYNKSRPSKQYQTKPSPHKKRLQYKPLPPPPHYGMYKRRSQYNSGYLIFIIFIFNI